jgi:preprotein translocase subunit SecF
MELLRQTNIDFMKYRKFWIGISLVLMAVGAFWILGGLMGFETLNFGIDFAGGTQMTLRFRDQPKIDEVRRLLETAGLGDATIQRFGDRDSHDLIIKTAGVEKNEGGNRDRILKALNTRYNQGQTGKPDLNIIDASGIAQLLLQSDPDRVRPQGDAAALAHYEKVGDSILEVRRKAGSFTDWNAVRGVQGASPAVQAALQQATHLGDYAVLGVENVGPQIGRELRAQGFWAVALSLLGMLCYIWFRFELRFGIGAVMASLHDVLVTFGLFAILGFEFNLTTVAAFLTLIGYSVNDTVVIFDRIRENMRKSRRLPLLQVMNESLNQTLSRTIMTSGLTLLTCIALLALGGDVLRGFAFVMTIGIIVGTYSSIYIASPFALLWEQYFGAEAKAAKRGEARTGKSPATPATPTTPAPPATPADTGFVEPGRKPVSPRPRAARRR